MNSGVCFTPDSFMHAMLYKFKSKAASDLIMLEPDGRRLLQIMTSDAPAKGIIEAAHLSAAISTLEAAVAQDTARLAQARHAAEIQDNDKHNEAVSLSRRAQPMLELLRKSQQADVDVVWGV
jgi:hypothetical protein